MNQPWHYWLNLKQRPNKFAANKNKPGRSQEHLEAIKEDMERQHAKDSN